MSDQKKYYFHFTLGPVQSFVAQARRTRDFWAGSFLLSWLSAVAIKSVQVQGGTILFPKPNENYLEFLIGEGEQGKEPKQGSIPNRFKAEINAIDGFDPDAVTQAVLKAWRVLADTIWQADIQPLKLKKGQKDQTKAIWKRQINGFWDMSWIITDNFSDSSVLDQRKNWRTYLAPNEAGIKCSVMEGWQELSGVVTPNRHAMNKNFWTPLLERKKKGIDSDLKTNEALCAIAFVKRRFSRYFLRINHKMLQGWRLNGWRVPSAVPSTSYLAAVPWLESALAEASPRTIHEFSEAAYALTKEYGEWQTDIYCIKKAKGKRVFKALDGDLFFKNALENPRRYEDKQQAKKVMDALDAINRSADLEPISPFYAVLIMDGDSLGKQMSDPKKQTAITEGLAKFTDGVNEIVYRQNGFLIYAGGDDVLALLPLEKALPCASELRQFYLNCFKQGETVLVPTTLSGAIEYVHIKTPLTKVLRDAHHLLDGVAKDITGRDAIAIRVWKPGGLQQQWSQPWEIALIDTTQEHPISYLEQLVYDFRRLDAEDKQFSSKFFYKLRQLFSLLNPPKDDENCHPKQGEPSQKERLIIRQHHQDVIDLVAMEYINSGSTTALSKIKDAKKRKKIARDAVFPLLKQCRPVFRQVDIPQAEKWQCDVANWQRSHFLNADAALLVRFLALKGIEK